MRPAIGADVHYVSFGTPIRADGSQAFASRCRAATVTEVGDDGKVGLAVLNPSGMLFHPLSAGGSAYYDGAEQPGTGDRTDSGRHGWPDRDCPCGWVDAGMLWPGGTWHWPEETDA